MSLLDKLSDGSVWEHFYEYKTSLACPKRFAAELRRFIDEKRYLPVCESIKAGDRFPVPEKSILIKPGSDKKRVVYTYPRSENTVLKLLTWLILRQYDGLFSRNLYSFRPGRTAKDAVRYLISRPSIHEMYSYKVDVHDYFNSVPVEQFLPMLKTALAEDEALYEFLARLLQEPYVSDNGTMIREPKGIMAGTPMSSFFANLYLSGLDRHFQEAGAIYARYSDDIIVFSPDEDGVQKQAEFIRSYLAGRSLEVNPAKESFARPGDGFVFLGFSCTKESVDVAPANIKKLKQKMRRKRDALDRWRKRKGLSGEKAAKGFIRIFNRKMFEPALDNELSWSHWFFSVINTAESLRVIDLYAQDCLRYLISGKHTKARYNVRYEDLKALGYRSLVNEYYSRIPEKA